MSLRLLLSSSVVVICSSVAVYNPPSAGVDLDAVEKALANIVNSPHLTKAQLASAKKVSADVEKTVAELESPKGKLLSKEARGAKVMAAIKELQGLQDDWQKVATSTIAEKKAELMKKLEAKEAELAKDKKMLKVVSLEKALAEKKLALQRLIDMKNSRNAADSQSDAAARQEMVAKVLGMAKSLQSSKNSNASMTHAVKSVADGKPAVLKTVLTYLEDRSHNITVSLAKIDETEKKRQKEVEAAVGTKAPASGKEDAIEKGKSVLHMLLKKEHRQFEKGRATLKNELKEINEAITSIKKGDAAGLSKVMEHMQGEMKSLQAKSHKFLY